MNKNQRKNKECPNTRVLLLLSPMWTFGWSRDSKKLEIAWLSGASAKLALRQAGVDGKESPGCDVESWAGDYVPGQ